MVVGSFWRIEIVRCRDVAVVLFPRRILMRAFEKATLPEKKANPPGLPFRFFPKAVSGKYRLMDHFSRFD